MRILMICVTSVFAAMCVAAHAAPTLTSTYSSTSAKDCSKISATRIDGDEIGSEHICPGAAGFKVLKSEDDLRETISVGRNAKAANREVAANQSFGPFNSTADTVEWRNREGTPFAIIQRWRILDNQDAGKDGRPRSKELLVVTRLGVGKVCHVAYIDVQANAEANDTARRAADELAGGFDCAKSKPKAYGLSGRATELALPK